MQDCKLHDKESFQCLEGLGGGQQTPQDLDYNCYYPGPFSPEWHSFLCYITNNNPYLGLFFKNEKIIQEYQKYLSRVQRPKYSYENSVLERDGVSFNLHYKVNRSTEMLLQSDNELTRGPLILPQPVSNGICISSIPVLFLKNFKHQCSLALSQQACENNPILSYDSYIKDNDENSSEIISAIISNLATLETVNATVNYLCLKSALKFIKVNGLSKTAIKYMKDRWDTMEEYFEECDVSSKPVYNSISKMCENVVLSVDYKFGWKGPNITMVNVEIIMGDVPISLQSVHQNYFKELEEGVVIDKSALNTSEKWTPYKKQYVGLLQNFEVQFYYSELTSVSNFTSDNDTMDIVNETYISEELDDFEYQLDSIIERSGNPGYNVGKPVLAGYLVNTTSEFENDTQEVFSHVDINDTTGLFIWLPDATSKCENVATDEVIFGIDAFSSCVYSIPKNYSCKEVRSEILSMMSQLVLADVVSKMGSPNVTDEDLFLPVIT